MSAIWDESMTQPYRLTVQSGLNRERLYLGNCRRETIDQALATMSIRWQTPMTDIGYELEPNPSAQYLEDPYTAQYV